jgi:dTDP-4-dehydrorhamnose reductase
VKIVLFGMNGQVGWELQRSLAALGEVVSVGRHNSTTKADFLNPNSVSQIVREVKPNVIVNAAAYTAVDAAEVDVDNVTKANSTTPGVLASEAKAHGALLVHYSTEYVFDGKSEQRWLETDSTAPLNVYGATKLEGERLIAESNCQHLILRTSWVYASRGKNFLKTMVKLIQERDELSVVSDQIGAPTGAALLADLTAHAICATKKNSKLGGLYHVAASGQTSWFDYACYIAKQIRIRKPNAKIANVVPVLSSAYLQRAQRPKNSRLNTEKFQKNFNLNLPDWKLGIDYSLSEILDQAL